MIQERYCFCGPEKEAGAQPAFLRWTAIHGHSEPEDAFILIVLLRSSVMNVARCARAFRAQKTRTGISLPAGRSLKLHLGVLASALPFVG